MLKMYMSRHEKLFENLTSTRDKINLQYINGVYNYKPIL